MGDVLGQRAPPSEHEVGESPVGSGLGTTRDTKPVCAPQVCDELPLGQHRVGTLQPGERPLLRLDLIDRVVGSRQSEPDRHHVPRHASDLVLIEQRPSGALPPGSATDRIRQR